MRCLNCGHNGLSLDTVNCPQCGVHLPSLMQNCLIPGALLYHETYRIDYPLGRGGFGITYRAFNACLNIPVAVKEFYPQEYAMREGTTGRLVALVSKQDVYQRGLNRFFQEGHLLAKLNDQGVVRVYNAFQERGTAYLVMELVSGKTLRSELDEQPGKKLTVERVKEVMSKLVDALSVVHQQNIYHLDIAADNIMVTPEGRVVLIDFGASRQGLGTSITQAFKESYAPPEVMNGNETGPESDVFELGMMLHEMLTGKLPPTSTQRLFSLAHHEIELWDSSQLEEPWRGLVASAIRLRQHERPHTVQEWWWSTIREIPKSPPLPLRPAHFLMRLESELIDLFILIVASSILEMFIRIIIMNGRPAPDNNYYQQLYGCCIIFGFFYCLLESSPTQGTFGKMLLDIAVTNKSGRRINFRQALIRHICKVFPFLILGIYFFRPPNYTIFLVLGIVVVVLMVDFTKNKKVLHNRIAKCLVIKRN